jgi:uncharacterized protein with GYD domain
MATFLMTGKYSSQALQEMSAKRTGAAVDLIRRCGGQVQSMYATLGCNDLVFIVEFPGVEDAMKASVALGRLTGIGFTTAPAVTVERFDKLIEQL